MLQAVAVFWPFLSPNDQYILRYASYNFVQYQIYKLYRQDLIRNKNTVQTIYNNNYNFAKAPDIPTVWSYAGDGFVTIYWDDVAERSNDIVTGFDFEGYKIYRTTIPHS